MAVHHRSDDGVVMYHRWSLSSYISPLSDRPLINIYRSHFRKATQYLLPCSGNFSLLFTFFFWGGGDSLKISAPWKCRALDFPFPLTLLFFLASLNDGQKGLLFVLKPRGEIVYIFHSFPLMYKFTICQDWGDQYLAERLEKLLQKQSKLMILLK